MNKRILNELVERWLNKPTFKLEDESGYEEYREKLLLYRLELQKNSKIKTLQEKILTEQKEQWAKFPLRSLADDPELNLFKDELELFCNEMYAKSELDNKVNLLNDIKSTFEDVKEQFSQKGYNEKVKLVRMYQDIDLSLVGSDVPGVEKLKKEIKKWIEATNIELENRE